MATLGTKAEGSIVKIKENGSLVDFYVAQHNYESGLNGSGRTLLVRKDCYDNRLWEDGQVNAYDGSDIDSWFNSAYKNSLDANIRSAIGATTIYYTPGNGNYSVTTLERSVFALSVTELGKSNGNANVEGSVLPIASTLEIAHLNGRANNQWTRSPFRNVLGNVWSLNSSGFVQNTHAYDELCGSRPAFTLPEICIVKDSGEVISNQPPTTPSSISFGTPKAGKSLQITCGASTDPDSDPITYVFERQIDSSSWAQIASGSATTVTDTVPSSGTNYNVRVKAKDSNGNESDYRTGTAKAIVYNQPPLVPASITFGDPHAGKPLQITCAASTDPDGNPITYIWGRQIDSGGWTQIGSGAETSITDTVPSSGTNYNVRVKARDSEGAESAYRNGSAKAIIYNQPPTIPGVPQYKYPLPGEKMSVKWQASTDPENGTVTYIVETKLGDGEWTQARETPETSCLVSVPQVSAVETMITVRVKAKDQEGAESAYSTGETVEILYHKVIRKIPWQRGKPFKARQYTYNGKKQYQTMREGALAGIEAKP